MYRTNGTTEWWNFKRLQAANGRPKRDRIISDPNIESAARASGASYHVKTGQDRADKEILSDHWLTLCAAITRCRTVFLGREADIFAQRMALQRTCRRRTGAPARRGTRELEGTIFGRATLLSGVES